MTTPSKKEVLVGLLVGLGIGIPALVIALLLSRPGTDGTPVVPTAAVATSAVAQGLPTSAPATPGPGTLIPGTPITPTSDAPGTAATEVVTHTVAEGESLLAIALEYDVTVQAIVDASGIENPDFIVAGQTLTIPTASSAAEQTVESGGAQSTVSPTMTLAIAEPLSPTVALVSADYPAVLEGDLGEAYPGDAETDRFLVHYTPGTFVEDDLQNVTAMLSRALEHIEAALGDRVEGSFDVYVAGSLFGPPDQDLRGRSFSAARRYFFLHDGTGNRADQQYIATHEMTHVFAWNVFGRPVSAMLSEGIAVYMGMTAIEDSDHMPIQSFCRAYQVAGKLPRISSGLLFEGHIRDLDNYYAAGCFVQYLVETYGNAKFADLYPTGDYADVYGKSLPELETEWRAALEASAGGPVLDSDDLFPATEDVAAAYDSLLSGFGATDAEWLAYIEIDAARIALLEGRLDDVAPHLAAAGYP